MKDKEDELGLDAVQKRILHNQLRDMKNGGVGLHGKDREVFLQINQNVSELSTRYTDNLLDSTKDYAMVVGGYGVMLVVV